MLKNTETDVEFTYVLFPCQIILLTFQDFFKMVFNRKEKKHTILGELLISLSTTFLWVTYMSESFLRITESKNLIESPIFFCCKLLLFPIY